jgi:hypothetical protein
LAAVLLWKNLFGNQSLWKPLTDRIESIIENKNVLFKAPDEIEVSAQKLAPEIIKNHAE